MTIRTDRLSQRVAFLMLPLLTAGCATTHPPELPWEDGWREATVTEVGLATEIGIGAFRDCRNRLPSEVVARARFVKATYRLSRMKLGIIAQIGDKATIAVSQVIYVNIRRCELGARSAIVH